MARGLVLMLLAWPVGELVAYWLVSSVVGSFPAMVLLAGGCLAGALLMRSVGLSIAGRLSELLKGAEPDWRMLSGSGGLMIAGLLLAIPGFLTDFIALGILANRLRQPTVPARRPGSPRDVIDLDSGDWKEVAYEDRTRPS